MSIFDTARDKQHRTQVINAVRHPAAGASTLPSEPHWVVAVSRSIDNPDEPPERRRINWNNPQSRKHAISYQTWCLYNRRSCTIAPEVEE